MRLNEDFAADLHQTQLSEPVGDEPAELPVEDHLHKTSRPIDGCHPQYLLIGV